MRIKRAKRIATLPNSFKQNESFKHDLAKGLLYSWLAGAERYRRQGQACRLGDISWRKSAGVFEELPIYENSNPYYFEHKPKQPGKILFIPDICVFSRGQLYLIFEIVHKSDITEGKADRMRKFFKDHFVEVHVIKADYILNHTARPNCIITKLFDLAA